MKFLTKDDMDKVGEIAPHIKRYYAHRWDYHEELINEIKKMENIEKTLELGPYLCPLVVGGDIMDLTDSHLDSYPQPIGKLYAQDAAKVPYPIEDKYYDLIIASQVMEHLGIKGEQKDVFNEFKRISKKAIISLPYLWFAPDERDHHMIDKDTINYWTDNYEPSFEKITGSNERKRIILIYDFD